MNLIESHLGAQTQNISEAINEELKAYSVTVAKQFEQAVKIMKESFDNMLNRFQLLQSDLNLFTPLTPFKGSRKCWKRGYFFNEDIRDGYDARRPIIDSLIRSIDNNNATILFGEGFY